MPIQSHAQGEGTVEIGVDVDSVLLSIDGVPYLPDSTRPEISSANTATIVLPSGEHSLEFSRPGYEPITKVVMVTAGSIAEVNLNFAAIGGAESFGNNEGAITEGVASLEILSDPDNAAIYLNNKDLGQPTPYMLEVPGGNHVVELMLEGYESLAERVEVAANQRASLQFVLKTLPPPATTADELGLVKAPQTPLMDENLAIKTKQWWNGLSETFLIVPLGQGLMAKLLLDDNNQKEANVLVISGVALTAGSYLLGKIMSARKRRQIIHRNEEIVIENDAVRKHNSEIDQIVRDTNNQSIERWLDENKRRGRVKVSVE